MRALRRAPRQVYRVYDEAEFLAGPPATGECLAPPPTRDRRQRRALVPALLLVMSAAAVAALVTSSLPTTSRDRRRRSALIRPSEGHGAPHELALGRGRAGAQTGGVLGEARRLPQVTRTRGLALRVLRTPSQKHGSPPPVARLQTASLSAQPRRQVAVAQASDVNEFGFER